MTRIAKAGAKNIFSPTKMLIFKRDAGASLYYLNDGESFLNRYVLMQINGLFD